MDYCCKDSAKFRFGEENTNVFAFLSVTKGKNGIEVKLQLKRDGRTDRERQFAILLLR